MVLNASNVQSLPNGAKLMANAFVQILLKNGMESSVSAKTLQSSAQIVFLALLQKYGTAILKAVYVLSTKFKMKMVIVYVLREVMDKTVSFVRSLLNGIQLKKNAFVKILIKNGMESNVSVKTLQSSAQIVFLALLQKYGTAILKAVYVLSTKFKMKMVIVYVLREVMDKTVSFVRSLLNGIQLKKNAFVKILIKNGMESNVSAKMLPSLAQIVLLAKLQKLGTKILTLVNASSLKQD